MLKKISLAFVAAAVTALLAAAPAVPQNATKKISITWVLPTKAMDGSDLTGAQAITKVQVFISGASIPDDSQLAPAAELGPVTSAVRPVTLPVGGTAFVRLKACHATACSDFSMESKVVFAASAPGVPTGVVVTVVLQ